MTKNVIVLQVRQLPFRTLLDWELQKLVDRQPERHADQGPPDVSLRLNHQRQTKLNRPVDAVSNKATKRTQRLVSTLIAYIVPRQVFLEFPKTYGKCQGIVKSQYFPLLSVTDDFNLSDPPAFLKPFSHSISYFLVWAYRNLPKQSFPCQKTNCMAGGSSPQSNSSGQSHLGLFKCKCTVFKFRPRVSYTGMV
jgi:hypothetical protein